MTVPLSASFGVAEVKSGKVHIKKHQIIFKFNSYNLDNQQCSVKACLRRVDFIWPLYKSSCFHAVHSTWPWGDSKGTCWWWSFLLFWYINYLFINNLKIYYSCCILALEAQVCEKKKKKKKVNNTLRNPCHIWGVGVMLLEGGFWGIIQWRANNPWQPRGDAIHHLPCPPLIWGGNNGIGCLCGLGCLSKVALTPFSLTASGDKDFTVLHCTQTQI